jgi:hypothetical protein
MASINIIDELLEEAAVLMDDWEARRLAIPWWHPRNESGSSSGGGSGSGSGGSGDGGGAGGTGAGAGSGSGSGSSDDNDDDDDDTGSGSGSGEVDWKKMARRHEREAKKERKAREAAEAKVTERETADQSEHEKAVKSAREEGEKVAREAADKERRGDRLENATIKLAGKGIKVTVKEDDKDVEKTLRFTDPDDAFVHIERMIRNGDLESDDLFDDKGKVKSDALKEALEELIDAKPHLLASASNGGGGSGGSGAGNGGRKVRGGADGGKGSGGSKSLDEMSTEEHFERIRTHK